MGLTYVTTDIVHHILLFRYYLHENGLFKLDETLEEFWKTKPLDGQKFWPTFFDDDCGVILNEEKNGITMSVFIGFENAQSKGVSIAIKQITIIEPSEYHYRVRTSTTA